MSIPGSLGVAAVAPHGAAGLQDLPPAAGHGPGASKAYVVERGDTLWTISARHLGDGRRYLELYEANRPVIGDSPDRLRAGMTLRIPDSAPSTGPAARTPAGTPADTLPVPAPATAPAGPANASPAGSTPPPAPSAPPPARPTPSVAPSGPAAVGDTAAFGVTLRSFVSPSGSGANTSVTGQTFLGATLREGEGKMPAGWAGVPAKPYREAFVGASIGGVAFDPATRAFDVLNPRAVAGYATGDGRSNLILQGWRALEPDTAGRYPIGAQASWARLDDRGRPQVRADAQIASPPPGAGATPKWSGRTDLFVPLDDTVAGNHVRLRAAGSHTGLPGQATSVAVSATLNTPPNPGNFPAGKPDAEFKPHLDVTVARTAAPALGDPGRTSNRIAVTGGALSPRTVATATVSHTQTAGVATTQLGVAALQRLGRDDIGQPPTSVTAGGIDPIHMPTGSYPAGARGQNTSAYLLGTVTLADAGITPIPGAFPGRDRVVAGVVHTTSHGRVASVYAQVTADLTTYADGASPEGGRARVDAGAHIRVAEDLPLTLHLGAGVGGGGSSVQGGVNLMIDPNTSMGAGVRYTLDSGELQPYAQIRIRL